MPAGFNTLMFTTHLQDSDLKKCEMIKNAGFDGVEVPIFEGKPEHFSAIAVELENLGLRRTSVGIVPSVDANPMGETAAIRQAGVDHLKWMVDCAQAVGAEVLCGPFFQPLGVFSGIAPTEKEHDYFVESHKKMAEYASGSGITLAFEPLNRFECYAVNTCSQATALVNRVDYPDYGFLFDTFHANIEERNIGDAIRASASAIKHVHFSENDRGTPGKGHTNYSEVSAALRDIHYDGWLVIETFGQALPALTAATRVWRPLFESEQEAVTEGRRVIKEHWG